MMPTLDVQLRELQAELSQKTRECETLQDKNKTLLDEIQDLRLRDQRIFNKAHELWDLF